MTTQDVTWHSHVVMTGRGGIEVFTAVPGDGSGFIRVTDDDRTVSAVHFTAAQRAALAHHLAETP